MVVAVRRASINSVELYYDWTNNLETKHLEKYSVTYGLSRNGYISSLYSHKPSNGNAFKALKELCDLADKHNVVLTLGCGSNRKYPTYKKSVEKCPREYYQLRALILYSRLGFNVCDTGREADMLNLDMVRYPR